MQAAGCLAADLRSAKYLTCLLQSQMTSSRLMTNCTAISHVSQALCHRAVHSLLVLVMSSCPCDSCHVHGSGWLLCCIVLLRHNQGMASQAILRPVALCSNTSCVCGVSLQSLTDHLLLGCR